MSTPRKSTKSPKPRRPVRRRRRYLSHSERVLRVLRRVVERKQTAHLWGQPHTIIPRVVTQQFGNGEKLIYFASMNHRPNYYVVRVDSSCTDLNGDKFRDLVDQIQEAIEADFGEADRDYDGEYLDCPKDFPAWSGSSGCFWGELSWADLLMDLHNLKVTGEPK